METLNYLKVIKYTEDYFENRKLSRFKLNGFHQQAELQHQQAKCPAKLEQLSRVTRTSHWTPASGRPRQEDTWRVVRRLPAIVPAGGGQVAPKKGQSRAFHTWAFSFSDAPHWVNPPLDAIIMPPLLSKPNIYRETNTVEYNNLIPEHLKSTHPYSRLRVVK